MSNINTDVLIVGAGPSGLVMAIELGRRGVSCLVIDEKIKIAEVLKANATQARTMEYFRKMGVADSIKKQGLPSDYPTDVSYHTRFNSYELARVVLPAANDVDELIRMSRGAWPSPEMPHRCNQMYVEQVLQDKVAENSSSRVMLSWKLLAFKDGGDIVRASIKNRQTDEEVEVTAKYLVGCDGANSVVRKKLGINYEGVKDVDREFISGKMCAIRIQSKSLYKHLPRKKSWMYWSFNKDRRGVLVAVNGVDNFIYHTQLSAAEQEMGEISTELAKSIFFEALGEGCDVQITDSTFWHAGYTLVAERYGEGRVLIVGDAVHLFTPSGGLGYNTAVEDAMNLAWKLAAIIKGYGGKGLESTYELERKPIAIRNTRVAAAFADSLGNISPSDHLEEKNSTGENERSACGNLLSEHAKREFNIPGVTFGARYDHSVIVLSDSEPLPDSVVSYAPSGVPGGRAPHLWLDGGASLYDCLGDDFTLLCFSRNSDDSHWRDAAQRLSVPLKILNIHSQDCVGEAEKLYGAELSLIRPDMQICWRGNVGADAEKVLRKVLLREDE